MNRQMGAIVVAAGFFLLPGMMPVWTRFESDVTVHMLSCDAKKVGGVCTGTEKADIPFTYEVSVDQRSVLFWRADNPGLRRKLPFCSIHDSKNWLCQWNGDAAPKARIGMAAGNYMEIAACTADTSMPTFHQVSMWRWWLVWLQDRLSPTSKLSMHGSGVSGAQPTRQSSGH